MSSQSFLSGLLMLLITLRHCPGRREARDPAIQSSLRHRWILDTPPSRGMTALVFADCNLPHSREAFRRRALSANLAPGKRGRAERRGFWPTPRPCVQREGTQELALTAGWPDFPGVPRAVFEAFPRLTPDGLTFQAPSLSILGRGSYPSLRAPRRRNSRLASRNKAPPPRGPSDARLARRDQAASAATAGCACCTLPRPPPPASAFKTPLERALLSETGWIGI
jgi:hypothetical protein